MTLGFPYRRLGRARLAGRRFLGSYEGLFTKRDDGSRWPKWRRTWKAANHYFEGLLAHGRGKTMQRMAFAVGIDENRLERFVRESPWEYAEVQRHLAKSLPAKLRSPRAALILDDVSILKQGRHSVGVSRQYAGARRRVDNCQVAVDLTYAVPGRERNADQATWPLGMRLYLPRTWVEDVGYGALRAEVHLPEGTVFQTKAGIALSMIDDACSAGLLHAVVVADAGYGNDADFRKALRERNEPYVMGVTPSGARVIPADAALEPAGRQPRGRPRTSPRYPQGTKRLSPRDLARDVKEWAELSWGAGTKGPLTGRFWRTRVRVTMEAGSRRHATDEVVWLLLEKRRNEVKAYFCWGLDDASLEDLVALAHLRWTIEQFHREAKQVLGMDRFEGRTWRGWHHHMTMVLLAYAFLTLLRTARNAGPRPTIPQIARALAIEKGAQTLMQEHGLPRPKAKAYAAAVLRGATDC